MRQRALITRELRSMKPKKLLQKSLQFGVIRHLSGIPHLELQFFRRGVVGVDDRDKTELDVKFITALLDMVEVVTRLTEEQ